MNQRESRSPRVGVVGRRIFIVLGVIGLAGAIAIVASTGSQDDAKPALARSITTDSIATDIHTRASVTTTASLLDGIDEQALVKRIEDGVRSAGDSDAQTATLVKTKMADIRASMGASDNPPDEREVIAVKVAGEFRAPNPVVRDAGAQRQRSQSYLIMWYQVPGLESTGSAIVGESAEVADLSQYGPTAELPIDH